MRRTVSRQSRIRHLARSWLPAIGFYSIILVLAAATFAFVMGVSTDVDDAATFLTAALIAAGVLVAGIVLRELILRNVREMRVAERDRLDRNVRHSSFVKKASDGTKFTLEKNALALENLRKKSDAANEFARISAGHREVFELCDEYRAIVEKELPTVHPNSPRLVALRKGSVLAGKLHRHHMLRWAEIESRSITNEAQGAETAIGKAAYAQRAKAAIDLALAHYPEDTALRESADVLDEILLSLNDPEVDQGIYAEVQDPGSEYISVSVKKNKAGSKKRKEKNNGAK